MSHQAAFRRHVLHAAGKPWLTIGMTTVPRRSRADYLSRTLETLMEELPLDPTDPLYARVNVLVMNNRPGNHSVFAQVSAAAWTILPNRSAHLAVCVVTVAILRHKEGEGKRHGVHDAGGCTILGQMQICLHNVFSCSLGLQVCKYRPAAAFNLEHLEPAQLRNADCKCRTICRCRPGSTRRQQWMGRLRQLARGSCARHRCMCA